MATPQYKGQLPSRIKGQTTCMYHKDRKLDIYCEECQELACIKCLSTVHKKHPLCDLSEITPKKNQEIQNFIDKTENADLVQIDQYITDTDTHLKDNASNFEKLSQQLKKQTMKIIQDLCQLSAQTTCLYQQMEEDNTKLLQTYKHDLEMYSIQLKQQVQECKIALQRGTDIQIYDAGFEIHSPVTLPVKPTLGTASFTSNQNPKGHIEQALGKVDTSNKGQGQVSVCPDQSFSGHGHSSTQKSSERKVRRPSSQQSSGEREDVSSPVYTLLSQTKVLEEWQSPYFNELFIYDGEVSKSENEPFKSLDVVYDSVGNLVIRDYYKKRVLLISGCGEFLRIIHTDDYYITQAVRVDREDVLWAVFGYREFKLLQYSSM
ncbi:uncharacterized protein LOC110453538 [Mizuhopecten yessoensis]|uniref:uncharacterized protein LOC110453538 n=1 Tax=Mizuhopecten yessoensis TaxID=6573 RepID=UPI000B45CA55|nr:uncharacterized protein LOC110453538 [Mizuhopecten yessoensis]